MHYLDGIVIHRFQGRCLCAGTCLDAACPATDGRISCWEAADLGNCPKSESSRKWLGEGAKGLLDPASKRPLALVRNGVAPAEKRVWVVQKTLGRPLRSLDPKESKRPCAPSPNHFWRLSLCVQFPRSTASQISCYHCTGSRKGVLRSCVGFVGFENHPKLSLALEQPQGCTSATLGLL